MQLNGTTVGDISERRSSSLAPVYFSEECCIFVNARQSEGSISDIHYVADVVTREVLADFLGDLRFS